jgi:HEAT repeat protein
MESINWLMFRNYVPLVPKIRSGASRRILRGIAIGLLITCGFFAPANGQELETLLDLDPFLPLPAIIPSSAEELQKLWVSVLEAPDVDIQRRAAEGIRSMKRLGVLGFESTVPVLLRVALDNATNPQVSLACLRALVELDAESTAPQLQTMLDMRGLDVALTVEPALARWDHAPMRPVWLARLEDPRVYRRYLLLAIDALGEVGEARAESALRRLVSSPTESPDIRWHAARALALVQRDELVELARELAGADSEAPVGDRALAAILLRRHESPAAQELLEKFALDSEPAVADAALARLIEVVPDRVRSLAPELLRHRDSNVRRWGIQAIGDDPNVPHIELLSARLNDPHPALRALARDLLVMFAEEHGLRDEVIEGVTRRHGESDWRGLEQATRILAQLDHKPASARMAELLPHERDEVAVTAAWGLRVLNVPETLEPAFAYSERMAKRILSRDPADMPLPKEIDAQLSHLLQFFGVQLHEPADALLRSLVPKSVPLIEARAAAVWSLGHLHASNPPDDLGSTFIERLQDIASRPSEYNRVRHQAAVSLGRMKFEAALPVLREFYEKETSTSRVGYACGWAVEQMTGEPVKEPPPEFRTYSDWFLVPFYPSNRPAPPANAKLAPE